MDNPAPHQIQEITKALKTLKPNQLETIIKVITTFQENNQGNNKGRKAKVFPTFIYIYLI